MLLVDYIDEEAGKGERTENLSELYQNALSASDPCSWLVVYMDKRAGKGERTEKVRLALNCIVIQCGVLADLPETVLVFVAFRFGRFFRVSMSAAVASDDQS